MTFTPDDLRLLSRSSLFDSEWYVATYPDVAEIDVDPVAHYLSIGAALGRHPSLRFDAQAYVKAYHVPEGEPAVLHFLKTGQALGHTIFAVGPLQNGTKNHIAPPRSADPLAVSHVPDALQRRLKTSQEFTWPPNAGKTYKTVRAHFDPLFYITKYYDLARTRDAADLLGHFMRAGQREERAPSPHFSTKAYMRRYGGSLKDGTNAFHHWITQGRSKGMIAHPMPEFEQVARILGLDPADCQEQLITLKSDLRERLEFGVLGEMVEKAVALEPLVSRTWRQAFEPNVQPFHRPATMRALVAIHALQETVSFARAKAIVCVDRPRWGSNRRIEGHVTHALASEYGAENIVFLVLEQEGDVPAHKYPDGVRCVNAAPHLVELDEADRRRVVLEFLRSLRADAVFNVNSGLLWDIQSEYAKIMKKDAPVVGCFLCNDKSLYGTWGGYPATQFYRQFANMKAVCTDSHFLREDLIRQFYVPDDQQDRIVVLEAPVDPEIAIVAKANSAKPRPQVFWASRLDPQKRVDIVYDIARAMPDIDIRMWGLTTTDRLDDRKGRPQNVIREGAYTNFEELPLAEADAFLYTSEWDGVPSILLEIAMTGVPVVGSLVGGTGEVLQEDLSWPVAPFDDVKSYVSSIREVLADPLDARKRAGELRARLVASRTEARYQVLVRSVMEKGSS